MVNAGISRLLGNIDKNQFLSQYHKKKTLTIKRNNLEFYRELLDKQSISELISSTVFSNNDISIVKNGCVLPTSLFVTKGKVNRNTLLEFFSNGATIIFNDLTKFSLTVSKYFSMISAELKMPLAAQVYLIPSNHEHRLNTVAKCCFFSLQLSGSREVFVSNSKQESSKRKQCILEPGDLIYIPQNTSFKERALNNSNMYINMLFDEVSISTILYQVFKELSHVKFMNFDDVFANEEGDEFKRILSQEILALDLTRIRRELYYQQIVDAPAPSYGLLNSLANNVAEIDLESSYQLSPYILIEIKSSETELKLHINGRVVDFAVEDKALIQQLISGELFKPIELLGSNIQPKRELLNKLFLLGVLVEAHSES